MMLAKQVERMIAGAQRTAAALRLTKRREEIANAPTIKADRRTMKKYRSAKRRRLEAALRRRKEPPTMG